MQVSVIQVYSKETAISEKFQAMIEFATNPQRKRSWKAFLNKLNRDKELEFEAVMRLISEKLMPYWSKMEEA